MLQSSETTTASDFDLLGYPNNSYSDGYYTAQPKPGIGVCIANMQGGTMVQLFPWDNAKDPSDTGHARYAAFIVDKATASMAENGKLFTKWPFMHTEHSELLIIKCLVEDGLNQVEKFNELQASGANAPTGKVVE